MTGFNQKYQYLQFIVCSVKNTMLNVIILIDILDVDIFIKLYIQI
jgi:hypothetical protein